MKVVRTPGLPASCSQLLLQITSSLLLGENIFLPSPFIQETVQTVLCVCVFACVCVCVCVCVFLSVCACLWVCV